MTGSSQSKEVHTRNNAATKNEFTISLWYHLEVLQ